MHYESCRIHASRDILEEITGEIDSEREQHAPVLEEQGLGQWLADGNISLDPQYCNVFEDDFELGDTRYWSHVRP